MDTRILRTASNFVLIVILNYSDILFSLYPIISLINTKLTASPPVSSRHKYPTPSGQFHLDALKCCVLNTNTMGIVLSLLSKLPYLYRVPFLLNGLVILPYSQTPEP